jgi:tRNA(Ile2) C34 agmatinyltransferase TiaS
MSDHAHVCRDCGNEIECDGRDDFECYSWFNGSCDDCQ